LRKRGRRREVAGQNHNDTKQSGKSFPTQGS
jgi:hypothetical protein